MIGYDVEKKLEGIQDEPDGQEFVPSGSSNRPADHLDVLPTAPASRSDRSEMMVYGLIMVAIVLASLVAAVVAGKSVQKFASKQNSRLTDANQDTQQTRYVLTKSQIESYLPVKARSIETANMGVLEFPEGKLYLVPGHESNQAFPVSDVESAMIGICPQFDLDDCRGFGFVISEKSTPEQIITEIQWETESEPVTKWKTIHLQFVENPTVTITLIPDTTELYPMAIRFAEQARPVSQ